MTTTNLITFEVTKHVVCLLTILFLFNIYSQASATVIDPEKHIQKNGYHSVRMGDDGKMKVYSFTERANSSRVLALESDIGVLPKDAAILNTCDFMRGGVKANLIQQYGVAYDVAVTNYGYSGATVACVLKYMYQSTVGTQLIFMKKGQGGMYMVFVTD